MFFSRLLPNIEINEMSISQSVECPLTTKDTAVIAGNLTSHNGTGSGTITVSLRRILSHSGWAEVSRSGDLHVSVKLLTHSSSLDGGHERISYSLCRFCHSNELFLYVIN